MINPILFRIGKPRKWPIRTFQGKYPTQLSQQLKIYQFFENLTSINVEAILVNRISNQLQITLQTFGFLPFKKDSITYLTEQLKLLTGIKSLQIVCKSEFKPKANVLANLLAKNYKLDQPITPLIEDYDNIKVKIRGRIQGVAKAKTITYIKGKLPLQQIKVPIDYGFQIAHTKYGSIGIQVWIY
jgi:small subunit ribosomal protein S3